MNCPDCGTDFFPYNTIADEEAKRSVYNRGQGLPIKLTCSDCGTDFKVKVTVEYDTVEKKGDK